MSTILRYLVFIFTAIVLSWAAEKEEFHLKEPTFIYKSSAKRESLFRTSVARKGSLQCLGGESVDRVPDINMRRQFPCPSRYAVRNVNYSVVFHEKVSKELSVKPYWTILFDMEVDPMTLGSLTGFLFRYKSLDSMHELFGETGFMFQNLPLTNLDINAAKNIALRSPYRNKDHFEIQICPLPLCPLNEIDSASDNCIKINVRIPDKRNKSTLDEAIEFPSTNECEKPSIMTSPLKTVLVNGISGDYVITVNPESASYDIVTMTDVKGKLISRHICQAKVASNPDFPHNIVEADKTDIKGCFLIHNMTSDNERSWETIKIFGLVTLVFICCLLAIKSSNMKRRFDTKWCCPWTRNDTRTLSQEAIYIHDIMEETLDDLTFTSASELNEFNPTITRENSEKIGLSERRLGLGVLSLLPFDSMKNFGKKNSSEPSTVLPIIRAKEMHVTI